MKSELAGEDNGPPRVAVVLGAAVWQEGPSPAIRRRVARALDLWHRGDAQHFVLCGGVGRWPPSEAEVMAELLCSAGVPGDRIALERRSASTWENLLFARPLLESLDARQVWIVTDDYHVPRALLMARRLGLKPSAASAHAPWTPGRARLALREIPAVLLHLGAIVAGRRRGPKG